MKYVFATALFAASLMAPAAAPAQNVQTATIPFDFTFAQRLLPAGTYRITYRVPGIITFRNQEKAGVCVSSLASPKDEVRKNPDKLMFHRYGNQYFLSEVRGDLGQNSGEMPPSPLEKRVQLQQAALADQHNVVVALK